MVIIPPSPIIVWFRQDLRLQSNPALHFAATAHAPILPIYILEKDLPPRYQHGKAGLWWLHHSLSSLKQALHKKGLNLILRSGNPQLVLKDLVSQTGAQTVVWNHCYDPYRLERDSAIASFFNDQGVEVRTFNSSLLIEPTTILTKTNKPYQVFTAFWQACHEKIKVSSPLPPSERYPAFSPSIASEELESWELLPRSPDWGAELSDWWHPGEKGGQQQLAFFLSNHLHGYSAYRDRPDLSSTSRLSPYLHWGEISPQQIWRAVQVTANHHSEIPSQDVQAFLRELGWREFCYYLLYHFPHLLEDNFKPFHFPWQKNSEALSRWQKGQTGYPLVDAGMRQLWQTGWMHNRLRMITASFLIKDLLIDWREGEACFRKLLVDADLANNVGGWQWVAGCGVDAAPYFRIFNPLSQGEKFDPEGNYVRQWVPELAQLPAPYIHKPWQAPSAVLAKAGVNLGETYPFLLVDHTQARHRALELYNEAALR